MDPIDELKKCGDRLGVLNERVLALYDRIEIGNEERDAEREFDEISETIKQIYDVLKMDGHDDKTLKKFRLITETLDDYKIECLHLYNEFYSKNKSNIDIYVYRAKNMIFKIEILFNNAIEGLVNCEK